MGTAAPYEAGRKLAAGRIYRAAGGLAVRRAEWEDGVDGVRILAISCRYLEFI